MTRAPSGILRAYTPRTHAALHFPAFWWSKNQSFGGHESSLSVAWPLSMLHCTSFVNFTPVAGIAGHGLFFGGSHRGLRDCRRMGRLGRDPLAHAVKFRCPQFVMCERIQNVSGWLARVLCTVLTVVSLYAEEVVPKGDADYVVDFWRTEQGLPHNTVSAILANQGWLSLGGHSRWPDAFRRADFHPYRR